MSKPTFLLAGALALVMGCGGVQPGEEIDDGAAKSLEDAPVAVIRLSENRRIEFFAVGNNVMVVQRYQLNEKDILSEADKQLSAPELYRKYAPANSEIPGALYRKVEPVESVDRDHAALVSAAGDSAAGGGQPVPPAPSADGIGRTVAALKLGEGCKPTQKNVVFSDCVRNWFGGYWARSVPVWFLDSRVEAVQGSLDAKFTFTGEGETTTRKHHVAEGQVLNQHWPRIEVCQTIFGVEISCKDIKTARRLDVINASATTFNVDVVFFNN